MWPGVALPIRTVYRPARADRQKLKKIEDQGVYRPMPLAL
jgi:hypothetical protein